MTIRRPLSVEEKVAKKLADIVCDLRLDLDQVGIYLGRLSPSTPYRRLEIVIESAEQEKSNEYDRNNIDYLF